MSRQSTDLREVRIEAISKDFSGTRILDDISLFIPAGQTVALVGSSGSGKTTLLRCINRLEEVSSGRILIGDADITARNANLNVIRRRIGMVFQQIHLYPHKTALQNVTLALRKVLRMTPMEADKIGLHYLAMMELADKAHSKPHQLSGGQQQRVGIARAMALDPDIILFDEPTSALDPELVGEVVQAIKRTREAGKTMIIVTHEMQFAREIADRVIFLNNGRIIADGPPAEVLSFGHHPRIDGFLQRVRNDA